MILGEGEAGERQRLQTRQRLSPHQHVPPVQPVNPDAGKRREEESWNLAGKADEAQKQCGAGEPIHQPTGCDAGHPGANQRYALTGKEQPEIAVLQGAPCMGKLLERILLSGICAGQIDFLQIAILAQT